MRACFNNRGLLLSDSTYLQYRYRHHRFPLPDVGRKENPPPLATAVVPPTEAPFDLALEELPLLAAGAAAAATPVPSNPKPAPAREGIAVEPPSSDSKPDPKPNPPAGPADAVKPPPFADKPFPLPF